MTRRSALWVVIIREQLYCLPIGKTLDDVLAFEEARVVSKDWCVQFNNRVFQISAEHKSLWLSRRDVIVREKLDGSVILVRGKTVLRYREIAVKKEVVSPTFAERVADHAPPWKPAAAHRWRKDGVGKASKRTT